MVIPGRANILFDGTVVYTKGSQAQINVALKNAFRDPVTVEGKTGLCGHCLAGTFSVLTAHHCAIGLDLYCETAKKCQMRRF